MTDRGLPREHRQAALDRLATIENELVAAANWLTGAGEDEVAIVLEWAARDVGAACWRLDRRGVTRSPHRVP